MEQLKQVNFRTNTRVNTRPTAGEDLMDILAKSSKLANQYADYRYQEKQEEARKQLQQDKDFANKSNLMRLQLEQDYKDSYNQFRAENPNITSDSYLSFIQSKGKKFYESQKFMTDEDRIKAEGFISSEHTKMLDIRQLELESLEAKNMDKSLSYVSNYDDIEKIYNNLEFTKNKTDINTMINKVVSNNTKRFDIYMDSFTSNPELLDKYKDYDSLYKDIVGFDVQSIAGKNLIKENEFISMFTDKSVKLKKAYNDRMTYLSKKTLVEANSPLPPNIGTSTSTSSGGDSNNQIYKERISNLLQENNLSEAFNIANKYGIKIDMYDGLVADIKNNRNPEAYVMFKNSINRYHGYTDKDKNFMYGLEALAQVNNLDLSKQEDMITVMSMYDSNVGKDVKVTYDDAKSMFNDSSKNDFLYEYAKNLSPFARDKDEAVDMAEALYSKLSDGSDQPYKLIDNKLEAKDFEELKQYIFEDENGDTANIEYFGKDSWNIYTKDENGEYQFKGTMPSSLLKTKVQNAKDYKSALNITKALYSDNLKNLTTEEKNDVYGLDNYINTTINKAIAENPNLSQHLTPEDIDKLRGEMKRTFKDTFNQKAVTTSRAGFAYDAVKNVASVVKDFFSNNSMDTTSDKPIDSNVIIEKKSNLDNIEFKPKFIKVNEEDVGTRELATNGSLVKVDNGIAFINPKNIIAVGDSKPIENDTKLLNYLSGNTPKVIADKVKDYKVKLVTDTTNVGGVKVDSKKKEIKINTVGYDTNSSLFKNIQESKLAEGLIKVTNMQEEDEVINDYDELHTEFSREFKDAIMTIENRKGTLQDNGWDNTKKLWFPFNVIKEDNTRETNQTIAYGYNLVNGTKVKIDGKEVDLTKGITDEQAKKLFELSWNSHRDKVAKEYKETTGESFNKLPTHMQDMMTELAFNIGSLTKRDIPFKKFIEGAYNLDLNTMLNEYGRKGTGDRVNRLTKIIKDYYGQ